ncbi:MAG: beta-propeller fold lactonase family protein [Planctomycetia bacterium]|nr:beta-propeller fold lactonase family protein [Planctomycetia bacterium]
MRWIGVFALLFVLSVSGMAQTSRVYFAVQGKDASVHGIYVSDLDVAAGKLTEPKKVVEVDTPFYLQGSPDGKTVYAVCEQDVNLVGFHVEGDQLVRLEPQTTFAKGAWLCHMAMDQNDLLVTCYGNGDFARIKLEENGAPGEVLQKFHFEGQSVNPQRQKESHPHSVNISRNGFTYVCDLGTDKIWIYRWAEKDGKRELVPNDPASASVEAGSGARHLVFHPQLPFVYVDNELSNTVTVFRQKNDGGLETLQTISTLPGDFPKDQYAATSEMRITPDGKFLYVANRGHNSIAAFRVENDGKLTFLEAEPSGGAWPRGFVVDSAGKYLVVPNRNSGNVVLMKIEPDGKLTTTDVRYTLPGQVPGVTILERHLPVGMNRIPSEVPNVSEWKIKREYPWSKIPQNLEKLTSDELIQEVILARVFAKTIDHLRRVGTMCDNILEQDLSDDDKKFVQRLAEASILQQTEIVVERLGNLSQKELKPLLSVLRGMRKNVEKVLSWNPDSAMANLLLAHVMDAIFQAEPYRDEDMELAKKYLNRGIALAEKDPDNDVVFLAESLALRARWTEKDDRKAALRDLDRAIVLAPELSRDFRRSRLRLYLLDNRLDDAMKELDEEIKVFAAVEGGNEEIQELKRLKIEILLAQNRVEDALALAKSLLKELPDDEELQSLEVRILYQLGRKDALLALLGERIEKNPLSSKDYVVRACLYFESEKYEEALEDVNRAMVFDPANKEAFQMKLNVLVKLNRVDEAVAEVEKLLKLQPKNFDLNCMLYGVYLESQQYTKAYDLLKKVAELFQFDKQMDTPEAAAKMSAATQVQAELFYGIRAMFYLMAGKHAESVRDYERALKLDPEDALSLNNLAWILCTSPDDGLRNADRAIELGKKACELTQFQEPGYLSTLAAGYAEKGDFTSALKWVQQGIEVAQKTQDAKILDSLNKEKASYEAKKPIREKSEDYRY